MSKTNSTVEYCKEENCRNRPCGICLHCNQHLCTLHIIHHGKIILHDADDFYQQMVELNEQLTNVAKSVHQTYINAVAECNAWRAKALETVEQTYNEMMIPIFYQQECFNQAEQDLTKRLFIDAKQPLDKMQAQQTGNAQALDAVRLMLEHVRKIIPLLQWAQKPLLPLPSTGVKRPSFDNTEEKMCTPLNERGDPNVPTPWQMLMNNAHAKLRESTFANAVDQGRTNAATPSSEVSTRQTAASVPSRAAAVPTCPNTNLQDYNPPKNMVARFADISDNGDTLLTNYLQGNVGSMKKNKMEKLINVVLALLHAWYKNKASDHNHLILQRASLVKRYVNNGNDQHIVILGIQVFIHHIRKDAQIVQTMTTILNLFLEQQLIREEDVFDWCKKNKANGLVGFDKAKECARVFISTLQSTASTTVHQ